MATIKITPEEFKAIKLPKDQLDTMSLRALQERIHQAIDRNFVDIGPTRDLKRILDINQYGLKDSTQLEYFLQKTPQGRLVQAVIGKESNLIKILKEKQIARVLLKGIYLKRLKAYLLLQAAKESRRNKIIAMRANNQANRESIEALKEQKKVNQTAAVSVTIPTLDITILKNLHADVVEYDELSNEYLENEHYIEYLNNRETALQQLNSNIEAVLEQYQVAQDLTNSYLLLLKTDQALETLVAKQQLTAQISLKREELLQRLDKLNAAEVDEDYDPELHQALLLTERQLKDHMLALTPESELNNLNTLLSQSNTLQAFEFYCQQLQSLQLTSETEIKDHLLTAEWHFNKQMQLQQAIEQIEQIPLQDRTSNQNLESLQAQLVSSQQKLMQFKAVMARQYGKRTYLDPLGQRLNNQNDLNNAYYALPEGVTSHQLNNTVYFIKQESPLSFITDDAGSPFIDKYGNSYLVEQSNQLQLVEKNGELYLLSKGASLEDLTHEQQQAAYKAAEKAKIAAFDARSLAEQYSLASKSCAIATATIEYAIAQITPQQQRLFSKLQDVEQRMQDVTEQQVNQETISTPTPKLTPKTIKTKLQELEELLKNPLKPAELQLVAQSLQHLYQQGNLTKSMDIEQLTKTNCPLTAAEQQRQLQAELSLGLKQLSLAAPEQNAAQTAPSSLPRAFDTRARPNPYDK